MIKLNMSDVISVLNMCKPYLIAIAVILVVGIVAAVMCKKMENPKRKLVRGNAILAMVLDRSKPNLRRSNVYSAYVKYTGCRNCF